MGRGRIDPKKVETLGFATFQVGPSPSLYSLCPLGPLFSPLCMGWES